MKYLKFLIFFAGLFFSLPAFSQDAVSNKAVVAKQLDDLEQQVKSQSPDWQKTGQQQYQDAKNLDDKTLQQRQDYLQAKGYKKPDENGGFERLSHDIKVKAALDAWLVSGKQQFVVVDPSGSKISQLDYPVKGPLYTLSGEVSFYDKFSLALAVTDSSSLKRHGIDRDWDPSQSDDTWLESTFSTKPAIHIYDVRLAYRLAEFDPGKGYFHANVDSNDEKFYLDIFGGWLSQTAKYSMRDGQWQIVNWAPSSDSIDGLDSSYRTRYSGPLTGISIQGVAKNGLIGRAEISAGFLRDRNNGYWNEFNYPFNQRGNGFSLGTRYDLFYSIKSFKFGIGWKYAYYKIKKLKESGVKPGYVSYTDEDIIRNVIFRASGPVFSLEYNW